MEGDTFSFIIQISSILFLSASGIYLSLAGVFILFLLICSALISSSEIAFFSLSPNDLNDLKSEQTKIAKRIALLLETPRTLLATILISNNFINIAFVILSDFVLRNILTGEICLQWGEGIKKILPYIPWTAATIAQGINLLITVVLVTFFLVLIGEVVPKVYAKINNIAIARFMATPLSFLEKIFYPFSQILVGWSTGLEKRLARRITSLASKEELDKAIELTVKDDEHNAAEEIDILKSIIHFGDVSVKQIMCSRVDIVALDVAVDYMELLNVVTTSGFSRLPVYTEDLDHITGILYVKDLLGHLSEQTNFDWTHLIRSEVLYVPEAKKIDDLLKEFQAKRMHMAIVVDEYGGTAGIVTLEDIMEEIIGEIRDEFDEVEEIDYEKIDDYNYLFEGKTLLNDMCRVVGLDVNTFDEYRGDADSLAGLILEMKGRLPKKGIELFYEDYKFKIISVNKKRIEQVQLTLPK